jgi:hypothetical protein
MSLRRPYVVAMQRGPSEVVAHRAKGPRAQLYKAAIGVLAEVYALKGDQRILPAVAWQALQQRGRDPGQAQQATAVTRIPPFLASPMTPFLARASIPLMLIPRLNTLRETRRGQLLSVGSC